MILTPAMQAVLIQMKQPGKMIVQNKMTPSGEYSIGDALNWYQKTINRKTAIKVIQHLRESGQLEQQRNNSAIEFYIFKP